MTSPPSDQSAEKVIKLIVIMRCAERHIANHVSQRPCYSVGIRLPTFREYSRALGRASVFLRALQLYARSTTRAADNDRDARKQVVGIEQVNRVLMQPHWRKDHDLDPL